MWCGVFCCHLLWCVICCGVPYWVGGGGVVCCAVLCCHVRWSGVIYCGRVSCAVVRCHVVWYDVVWCGGVGYRAIGLVVKAGHDSTQ